MKPPYAVAADFHVRADAVDVMMQRGRLPDLPLVTRRRGSNAVLLYMEWRDKACFDAHVASPHVQRAEQRLEQENLLTEPAGERHFHRL
jgi:hypothetical protein